MRGLSMQNKAIIAGAITLFFLFGQVHSTLAGFGISPPSVQNARLVPGSSFERTIYLVQGNPTKPLDISVTIDSKNMGKWISFEPKIPFTIPAGVQQFPLKIHIAVPKDAVLGIYKAFVRIQTEPEKAKKAGGVAIALGGRIDIELTVGDDIVESFEITNISINDVYEGDNPSVSLTLNNTGNVPASLASASFELYNKFGNIRLGYGEVSSFEEVPAFSEKNIKIEFPIGVHLAMGEYWGTAIIYNDENRAIKEVRSVFNVRKGGLLAAVGSLTGSLWVQLFIAAVVLILLAVVFYIIKRRRRKARKRFV